MQTCRHPRIADGTLRERRMFDAGTSYPDCCGDLWIVDDDVSELLDTIVAQLKVIEIAWPKRSRRRCGRQVQSPASNRPIPCSMAGPGLLFHIIASKFADYLRLHRQAEIFAHVGRHPG